MPDTHPPRLALLISFSGMGGVERMVMNLVRELATRPLALDLLLIRAEGPHLAEIPANVTVHRLNARHNRTAVREIADYLRAHRPDALLAAKDRAGRAALRARRRAGSDTRIAIRLGTHLSAALAHKPAWQRWLRTGPMRRAYAQVDRVIAVSNGVRQDTLALTGLPAERVVVIRNPVIAPDLATRAAEPAPHPWLEDAAMPVIIGAGRFSRQKDFPTLLRAFARLRAQRPARLVILGEGDDRPQLERLAAELGIAADLLLPGFQTNPYAWLARARLFVLSSRWEGSPNVLTEALALGIPAVATRCPSGPDETLADGRYGPLVAIGDVEAMAAAMAATLDAPLPPDTLRAAVRDYRPEISADHYLRALGLEAG